MISTLALSASWARARFSSSRVIANQRSLGISLRVVHRDKAIGVARVSDDKDAHIFGGIFLNRLSLADENLAVDAEQIACVPCRPCAELLPTSRAQFTSRKPSARSAVGVIDLRSGNAQSRSSITTPSSAPRAGRNFDKAQRDRLVRAEHRARGNAKEQGIADLAGCASDGDFDRSFHRFFIILRHHSPYFRSKPRRTSAEQCLVCLCHRRGGEQGRILRGSRNRI